MNDERFELFVESAKTYIKARAGAGKEVYIKPVRRNNDIVKTGIAIIEEGKNISPTIYLEPYYAKIVDGRDPQKVYEEIWECYEKNREPEKFDFSKFVDFEKAKKRIFLKLVNTEKNREYLELIPSVPFLDLSIIFCYMVEEFKGEFATIQIYNEHMEMWDTTPEELYEIALKNTPELLEYNIKSTEPLKGYDVQGLSNVDENMYILTNKLHTYGAGVILYPGLMEKLFNFFEDNFYIIPSSVHEVMFLTEGEMLKVLEEEERVLGSLNDTILEVNNYHLDDEAVLSDHLYYYNGSEIIIPDCN